MNSRIATFSIKVIVFLGLSLTIHILANNLFGLPSSEHNIFGAYGLNALFAIAIFWSLTSLKPKYDNQIGFLFLASSFVKFFVFFIFFYRPYKADGEISLSEFITFFLPYTVSLILETYYLSKHLNKK